MVFMGGFSTADAVTFTADWFFSPDGEFTFVKAYDRTHLHLEAMGAKVAASKCNTFSVCDGVRRWLWEHRWRCLRCKVPVVN